MQTKVFLDTAYAIALSIISDTFHERAIRLSERLTKQKTRLVTTRPILLEIGNALSKLRYRNGAILLLRSLELDPSVEIVPLSEPLYQRAFQLYCDRADKTWGLIDCISFVVMQDRGITEALTTDEHFQQAGFRVLLREDVV